MIEKPAYGLIKLSVLFFYRRVFNSSNTTKTATSIMILLITLWTISFLFASLFICGGHPQTLWSKDTFYGMNAQNCGDTSKLLLWFAITDVIGDITILALPYPRIRRMKVSMREKLGISGILLLGTLWVLASSHASRGQLNFDSSTAAGIVRLGFVSLAFTGTSPSSAGSTPQAS